MTRIPLPGNMIDTLMKGVTTGSNMYSGIMHPILEREQLAQRQKQFEQELALKKAQFARSGQNMDLQRQLLQQQILSAQHANDPNWDFNNFMNIANRMGGSEGDQGFDVEKLKNNPIVRGYFKHKFGIDLGAQTPEQKAAADVSKAVSIDEAKANRKKIEDIENTARALLPYAGNVKTIEDILTNKPDITGRSTQAADMLGMTKDEDVGRFISAAQNLQAHMAKEMSSRGGYGVSKLVEQGKPNIGKTSAFNKGVINELKATMKAAFEQMDSDYMRLKGEHLPFDFQQFYKAQVGDMANKAGDGKKRLKFNPVTGRLE